LNSSRYVAGFFVLLRVLGWQPQLKPTGGKATAAIGFCTRSVPSVSPS
jgi:hypothetical protein